MEQLHIHFDVDDHFIPLDDFMVTSDSAAEILDNLNKKIFAGNLKYELVVEAPTDGTFRNTMGIILFSAAIVPIAGDYSIGVFEELTGHPPSHYGEQHGKALRDLAVGFLSKEVDDLERCIPYQINLDRAFKAKSEFYETCHANKDIKGIGFDETDNFPIPRERFLNHTSKDRIRELDSDFVICEAIVISPVNVDKDTQWELKDTVTNAKINAYMRDRSFKNAYLNGKYPFKETKEDDILKIMLEYKQQEKNGKIEKKETCINTVYKYNEVEILQVPSNLPQGTRFQRPETAPMDNLWQEKKA